VVVVVVILRFVSGCACVVNKLQPGDLTSLSTGIRLLLIFCMSLCTFQGPDMEAHRLRNCYTISAPVSKTEPELQVPAHIQLRWSKLTPNATAPTRGSAEAAGFDLYAAYDITIPARGKALVKTDIQVSNCECSFYQNIGQPPALSFKMAGYN
jgi:hypothetical protein